MHSRNCLTSPILTLQGANLLGFLRLSLFMCVRYNLTNFVFLAYVPHLIAAIGMDFRKPYS